MGQRRFTRLTNGFSKKLDNHVAAVALYVAHYNLCRVHEALKTSEGPRIAVHYGNDYALALTLVVVIVAIIIAAMTGFGVEAKDVAFGRGRLQVRRPASGGT